MGRYAQAHRRGGHQAPAVSYYATITELFLYVDGADLSWLTVIKPYVWWARLFGSANADMSGAVQRGETQVIEADNQVASFSVLLSDAYYQAELEARDGEGNVLWLGKSAIVPRD